jgi:SAM-dependent methyltransferase
MSSHYEKSIISLNIVKCFFPEAEVGGFCRFDGMVEFYGRIYSILKPDWNILDFGAGRGNIIETDLCEYRRELKTFKGKVARVVGCDVDPKVLTNPYLDEAVTLEIGRPLPFADNQFDMVFSAYVLEHVSEPELVSKELLRITKPGGWIVAVTPNKFGYVALAAMLIKNSLHAKFLSVIQPERYEMDVFPTHYLMNTKSKLKQLFSEATKHVIYANFAEPTYHFNSKIMFYIFNIIHKFFPKFLGVSLFIFIQK